MNIDLNTNICENVHKYDYCKLINKCYCSNCSVVIRIRPDAMGEKLVINLLLVSGITCTKIQIINLELSFK